jgi:hypothetical protein
MAECYARILSDCGGRIEDEHFFSAALQRMLGEVTISGFAWQGGTPKKLPPTTYAHGRVLCQKHHDHLDGLDGNATNYFRNLMLSANPNHVATGQPGRAEDISALIDGRALEKWFLKLLCGIAATDSVENAQKVRDEWVLALSDTTTSRP